MRRWTREEGGFTLAEIMVVSSLFLVVLSATLTAAASFERLNHSSQQVNEQVETARRGVDRSMRQLRNLARRIDEPVIKRAERSDFIFQTSDPERTWVRHCLQQREDGSTWLWALSSPATVSLAMAGPCPGSGWTRRDVVVKNVTNYQGGRSFPMFSYGCVATAPAGCPASASDYGRITSVRMDLLVDDDLTKDPHEARITSAVYLRNQNEPPVASFSWRPIAARQILLNASASFDPEGRTLRFMWFRAPAPTFNCNQQPPTGTLLWQGVTLPHTFLSTEGVAGTLRPLELVVCDPGDLQSRATQQVTIP
jgi:type II secretory pathway pseudopilin PulG